MLANSGTIKRQPIDEISEPNHEELNCFIGGGAGVARLLRRTQSAPARIENPVRQTLHRLPSTQAFEKAVYTAKKN
jgi:hypothetical protein